MLDHTDRDEAHAKALRDAEYASLTCRAETENAHAFVDDVLRQIVGTEERKRQRVSKAGAFRQAAEGFLADLLLTIGHDERWVYRPVSQRHFTDDVVSYRDFTALRMALKTLGLLEEARGVQHWSEFGVIRGWATRFRATPRLERLAAQYDIQPAEVSKHFIRGLPEHPLVLRGGSRRAPEGYKIPGEVMKISRGGGLAAMEQTIIDLNKFIDQFDIRGGTHRGYIRVFNLGDHPAFNWKLGGRFYSLGEDSYQQMKSGERLKMTIDGKSVCELDIKASYLTIFQSLGGQPLDFASDPDPYQAAELRAMPRYVVKAFITATFGNGQFPDKWPQKAAQDHKAKKTGKSLKKQYPIEHVRDAVAKAYPLLARLGQDEAEPPIWAKLMFLESQAVFRTMLALQERGIPSLSVHDSLIVQRDREHMARETLSDLYNADSEALRTGFRRKPDSVPMIADSG